MIHKTLVYHDGSRLSIGLSNCQISCHGELSSTTLFSSFIFTGNLLHSQCVTNIEVSQAFSSWSNVGWLRFDQHLVKWLNFDQPVTIGDFDLD